MADIKRAQCSRRGYRSHLNKLLASVNDLLASPDALSEDNKATLTDFYEQLQRKEELIAPLDAKILEATVEDDAIEAEILQTEEINTTISTAKAKIKNRLRSVTVRETPAPPPSTDHHVEHDNRVTRLPKLVLLTDCCKRSSLGTSHNGSTQSNLFSTDKRTHSMNNSAHA